MHLALWWGGVVSMSIEKINEIEKAGAYLTGKGCMDPAKNLDTSGRLFLAL